MKRKTNLRVLYVEDNEDACELVATILGFANIDVASADSIDGAWHQATSESFDLYLLDGKVQQVRTLGLCGKLREFAPDTPVLFYTGLGAKSDIQDGMSAGAAGYLIKPYFGDLAEQVSNTVRRRSASQKP